MKKRLSVFAFIILIFLIALIGCTQNSDSGNQGSKFQPEMQIVSLSVHSYAENEQGIYSVEYPEAAVQISAQTNGEAQVIELSNCILPENLSTEEKKYLYDYINGLPEEEDVDNDEGYAYYVYFTYRIGGKETDIFKYSFNTFPEEWDTFVSEVNRICGGDYLTGVGEVQRFDVDFVRNVYGLTDDDIVEGTLEEYLAEYKWEMGHAISESWDFRDWVDEYNKMTIYEEWSSVELRSAESTEDEFQVMVYDYMNTLGEPGEWTEMERGIDAPAAVRYFRQTDGPGAVIIGRTEDLGELKVSEPYEGSRITYYRILCVENSDKYDRLPYAPFYYSDDDKFFLVCYNVEDDAIASFVQERSADYYENLIATVLEESKPEDADVSLRLEDYPFETVEYYIGDYRPADIVTVESTEVEFSAFVDDFIERMGETELEEPRLVKMPNGMFDGFICLRDLNNGNLGDEIYIAPSSALSDYEFEIFEIYDESYYRIVDREGNPEGMVYSYDFIYTEDCKYVMIYDMHYTRLDVMLNFIEYQE